METINLSHYPQSPWVYIFKDKRDNILYIWKAKNLKKRISQYFSPWSVWKQEMVAQAEKIEFIIVENVFYHFHFKPPVIVITDVF